MTDGPEYTVQKILKHCVAAEDDQFDFLIKWADYEYPSWTKRDHVPEEPISGYFWRCHRRSPRVKRPVITRGTMPDPPEGARSRKLPARFVPWDGRTDFKVTADASAVVSRDATRAHMPE